LALTVELLDHGKVAGARNGVPIGARIHILKHFHADFGAIEVVILDHYQVALGLVRVRIHEGIPAFL